MLICLQPSVRRAYHGRLTRGHSTCSARRPDQKQPWTRINAECGTCRCPKTAEKAGRRHCDGLGSMVVAVAIK
jgi:hypothetical protein